MQKTRKIKASDLACGGMLREEKNGRFVVLYKEGGVYSILSGFIGKKFDFAKSFHKLTDAKKEFCIVKGNAIPQADSFTFKPISGKPCPIW